MGKLLTKEDTTLHSVVQSYPLQQRYVYRLHQLSSTVFKCIFIGYALSEGSVWTGRILVADAAALKDNTASEVNVKRFTHIFFADGSIKLAECGPNRHTTNPSRLYSNVVEESSGCPLGEKKMIDLILRKNKQTLWKRNTWSTSGNFMYRHPVMNRDN